LEQSAAVILLCCGSGLDEQSPALFITYYLTLSKSQAAVPADEYKIPHHRQYLLAGCNFYENLFNSGIFTFPVF
jgi:hypothetical protein